MKYFSKIFSSCFDKVKRIYERFFQSEFNKDDKCFCINEEDTNKNSEYNKVLRHLAALAPAELKWRRNRSYLLTDKLNYIPEVNKTHSRSQNQP
jgi:hypothetical protein